MSTFQFNAASFKITKDQNLMVLNNQFFKTSPSSNHSCDGCFFVNQSCTGIFCTPKARTDGKFTRWEIIEISLSDVQKILLNGHNN